MPPNKVTREKESKKAKIFPTLFFPTSKLPLDSLGHNIPSKSWKAFGEAEMAPQKEAWDSWNLCLDYIREPGKQRNPLLQRKRSEKDQNSVPPRSREGWAAAGACASGSPGRGGLARRPGIPGQPDNLVSASNGCGRGQ